MKVIDLLNKIAKGEELPERFEYIDEDLDRYVFTLEADNNYWSDELCGWFFSNWDLPKILNDEICILGEDK